IFEPHSGNGLLTEQFPQPAVAALSEVVLEETGQAQRFSFALAISPRAARTDERTEEIRIRPESRGRVARRSISKLTLAHVEHQRVAADAVERIHVTRDVALAIVAKLDARIPAERLLSNGGVDGLEVAPLIRSGAINVVIEE